MSLLDSDMLEKLLSHPPDILTFSLHGAPAESFEAITKSSYFNKCIENFENLLFKANKRIKKIRILCALQLKNLGDYNAMFLLLKKWNMLNNFNLLPCKDFKTSQSKTGRIFPTDAEKKEIVHGISTALKACDDENKRSFLYKWKEVIREIKSSEQCFVDNACLVPWYSTYITSKGNVLPCCYLTNEKYIMGNIYSKPFSEIWNGVAYREFRNRLRDNRKALEECYRCSYCHTGVIEKYRFILFGTTKWKI